MIKRSRQHHENAKLVCMYKAHVLSFVEYRTSAIYHASQTNLASLDRAQTSFLRDLGISDLDALMQFN